MDLLYVSCMGMCSVFVIIIFLGSLVLKKVFVGGIGC